MRISSPVIAMAVVLAAANVGAFADSSIDGNRSVQRGRSAVQYGDLDLANDQDARIMLRRIERAAAKACGGHPTFSSYTGLLDDTFATCRAEAVRRTVEQLGAPAVTRIYSAV